MVNNKIDVLELINYRFMNEWNQILSYGFNYLA